MTLWYYDYAYYISYQAWLASIKQWYASRNYYPYWLDCQIGHC